MRRRPFACCWFIPLLFFSLSFHFILSIVRLFIPFCWENKRQKEEYEQPSEWTNETVTIFAQMTHKCLTVDRKCTPYGGMTVYAHSLDKFYDSLPKKRDACLYFIGDNKLYSLGFHTKSFLSPKYCTNNFILYLHRLQTVISIEYLQQRHYKCIIALLYFRIQRTTDEKKTQ